MNIDIRHSILLAINMFKYGVAMPWDWDPFHTISNLTWLNACLLLILFLVFSFICIKIHVPFTRSASASEPSSSATITTLSEVVLRFGERTAPSTPSTTTTGSTGTTHGILLEFGQLSAPLAFALMTAVLVFPQALFWYAYPIIVFISSCSGDLKRFANWFHTVLTTIPVLNVIMTATVVGWQAFGAQADYQISERNEGNTQAPAMGLGDDALGAGYEQA